MRRRLEMLQTHLGRAPVLELVEVTLQEVPRLLERIRAEVEAGRPEEVAGGAHSLRGICGNLGASTLAEGAQDLQEMGARGALAEAGARVRRLGSEWDRLEEVLHHLQEELRGAGPDR